MCSTPTCRKPSWNREPGEYCTRKCRNDHEQLKVQTPDRTDAVFRRKHASQAAEVTKRELHEALPPEGSKRAKDPSVLRDLEMVQKVSGPVYRRVYSAA